MKRMDREQREWEKIRTRRRQVAWKDKVGHREPMRRRRKLTDGGGREEDVKKAPRKKKLKFEKAMENWGEAVAPKEHDYIDKKGGGSSPRGAK